MKYNHDLGPIQTQNGQNLDLFIVNDMNCDKKGPLFWIIFRIEEGPNFLSFHETKRSKINPSIIILDPFYQKMANCGPFYLQMT